MVSSLPKNKALSSMFTSEWEHLCIHWGLFLKYHAHLLQPSSQATWRALSTTFWQRAPSRCLEGCKALPRNSALWSFLEVCSVLLPFHLLQTKYNHLFSTGTSGFLLLTLGPWTSHQPMKIWVTESLEYISSCFLMNSDLIGRSTYLPKPE